MKNEKCELINAKIAPQFVALVRIKLQQGWYFTGDST